ncbi:MAG: hypothetical protein H6706_30110 [Myxococcales bacterium]|nr:hypothetical protein [Myxococcales bacterium]
MARRRGGGRGGRHRGAGADTAGAGADAAGMEICFGGADRAGARAPSGGCEAVRGPGGSDVLTGATAAGGSDRAWPRSSLSSSFSTAICSRKMRRM